MASLAIPNQLLPSSVAKHYSRSLWHDPYFLVVCMVTAMNLAAGCWIFADNIKTSGFGDCIQLLCSMFALLVVTIIGYRANQGIREALRPTGNSELLGVKLNSVPGAGLIAGVVLVQVVPLFANVIFTTMVHLTSKFPTHH
jgi:hypothetical protein